MPLTQERLKELFHYSLTKGVFTRRVARGGQEVGSVAGWSDERNGGRVTITIDGMDYFAHRLAWLYVKGEMPEDEIDHRDTDPSNNRWYNLRPATSSQNKGNSKARLTRRRNGGTLKGAFKLPGGRWRSQINMNRKSVGLGVYDTELEAHQAYLAKAEEYFGAYARAA